MLALLTRQRDMLKIERFFNMFREHVAVCSSFRDSSAAVRIVVISAFQRGAVPLCEVGAGFVGALAEVQQGCVGIGGGADVVVQH